MREVWKVAFKMFLGISADITSWNADSTAFSLCMDNNMPIIVFDLGESGNIERALRGEELGTVVCGE